MNFQKLVFTLITEKNLRLDITKLLGEPGSQVGFIEDSSIMA
jgi:hypothetical protein